jgi:P27 family predicted phage terminase small subunit
VHEAPEPPDWLSAEARAEWDRITPGLERLDLFKPEDRAGLTVYTETWSTYVAAVAPLPDEGLTLVNPDSGHTSVHPCVQIAHNAGQLLLRYAAEFGLTPSAERRLGSITPPDDDVHSPYGGG